MSGDWQENVLAATAQWLDDDLGQDIEDDARGYCPVLTGDLAGSLEHHMNGYVLVVKATGSDERFYAVYVEMGHRVFHPSTGIVGPETVPEEPFLRPALYQIRRP
jgi:hypothetical protein